VLEGLRLAVHGIGAVLQLAVRVPAVREALHRIHHAYRVDGRGAAGERLVAPERVEAVAEALVREPPGLVGRERGPQERRGSTITTLHPAQVPGVVVVILHAHLGLAIDRRVHDRLHAITHAMLVLQLQRPRHREQQVREHHAVEPSGVVVPIVEHDPIGALAGRQIPRAAHVVRVHGVAVRVVPHEQPTEIVVLKAHRHAVSGRDLDHLAEAVVRILPRAERGIRLLHDAARDVVLERAHPRRSLVATVAPHLSQHAERPMREAGARPVRIDGHGHPRVGIGLRTRDHAALVGVHRLEPPRQQVVAPALHRAVRVHHVGHPREAIVVRGAVARGLLRRPRGQARAVDPAASVVERARVHLAPGAHERVGHVLLRLHAPPCMLHGLLRGGIVHRGALPVGRGGAHAQRRLGVVRLVVQAAAELVGDGGHAAIG
jgi:hypothetical protein